MKCQQFSRRLGVSQQWCACYVIYEGREEANENCKWFPLMMEVSSSDWVWHSSPRVVSLSCQAETSSFPCSLLLKNIVWLQVKCKNCFRRVLVLDCRFCRAALEFHAMQMFEQCCSDTCRSSFLHPLPLRKENEELCSYCPAANLVNNKWWL